MIEMLEARQLMSSTPASLVVLRKDVAQMGYPLGDLLHTANNVISRAIDTLKTFKTRSDIPLEAQLRTLFSENLHALGMDVTVIKTRLNADAILLAKAVALQAKQPTNPKVPALIAADEALLSSQATAGITAIETDAGNLILNVQFAVNQIVAAHPADATPGNQLLVLTNAISSATNTIESTMNRISNTDVPAYIAEIVPGSLPAA